MNIAFCINRLALAGLGPTLSSVIRNCTKSSRLTIWLLCAGFEQKDKDAIARLLIEEDFKGAYHIIDFDPVKEFGGFASLHGDWTAYGRLLLPELLQTEARVLYLDADLIIELDVLELTDFDLQNKAVAVVSGSTLRHALDHPFLVNKLGLSLDSNYFNSGVLLFDLELWRKNKYKEQCLSIAKKYPNDLVSHDQTLLNAVFNNEFAYLPKNYNCPWYAGKSRPNVSDRMIIHYLGSPKPWDIGGRFLHNGYSLWKTYLNAQWAKSYTSISSGDLKRAWKIRRSYLRLLKSKIKGH
ncbi:glycosyltransferase family 8 protein [Pedobacter metabolipauper]|uniref:Lipopolysaccharide biosynthesis glycosyltransferase n=1 Tax=Pedobacter metabolipauper TaxID=425513 RepID=A0A4R6SX19_9SPHI|nr:glycosyltransferase family 8 protein [Pedobacter metabolipauper]TDQ09979.1 lipopolysaccharide biosynthesis glycosyltransferase [Pedobacter metabolipauper]